jgi:hypothetical protein
VQDARRGILWRIARGRVDEIDPILEIAHRHAKLYFPGGIAQSHASLAELVVDRQLPDAPGINERYPGEVDQRRPLRSQAVAQGVLQELLVENVDLSREPEQYGSILAPAALWCLEYRWVVLYGVTPVSPV